MNDGPVTRDDLDQASVGIEALRQDLAGYRITIEKAMSRRNRALRVAAAGVLALLALQVVGGWLILRSEGDRARATIEAARMESCRQVAELRVDLVTVLVDLGGEERFENAIEILQPGSCAEPTDQETS